MSHQIPMDDALRKVSSDVEYYTAAADAIREHFDFKTRGVSVFGPGYPAFLAAIGVLTGPSPRLWLLVQVILSALGSVLLARLAECLTGDRRVGITAGSLHALSIAAISLGVVLLSDTIYLVVSTAGLLLFALSLDRPTFRRVVGAGLLLGAAALIRSVGQFALIPLLCVTFCVPQMEPERFRDTLVRRLSPLFVVTVIYVAVAGAWVWRNHEVYGVTYVAGAADINMVKLNAVMREHIEDVPAADSYREMTEQAQAMTASGESYELALAGVARRSLFQLVATHPMECLRLYLLQVDEGTHTDWGVLHAVFPAWDPVIRHWTHKLYENRLRYRVAFLAFIGALILVFTHRTRVALSLVALYVFNALLAGLNLWQGNRIFYQGQIAWTPLVAVTLVTTYIAIQKLWKRTPEKSPDPVQ